MLEHGLNLLLNEVNIYYSLILWALHRDFSFDQRDYLFVRHQLPVHSLRRCQN